MVWWLLAISFGFHIPHEQRCFLFLPFLRFILSSLSFLSALEISHEQERCSGSAFIIPDEQEPSFFLIRMSFLFPSFLFSQLLKFHMNKNAVVVACHLIHSTIAEIKTKSAFAKNLTILKSLQGDFGGELVCTEKAQKQEGSDQKSKQRERDNPQIAEFRVVRCPLIRVVA